MGRLFKETSDVLDLDVVAVDGEWRDEWPDPDSGEWTLMNTEEFLSTSDVARLAKVDRTTVFLWYKHGKLKGKMGFAKNLCFHNSVVKEFLEERERKRASRASLNVTSSGSACAETRPGTLHVYRGTPTSKKARPRPK